MTDAEEMARRQAACDHVAGLVKTVYAGKPSSRGFIPKRISASSLVANKAEKIALELIDAHDAHERNAMPAFKGSYMDCVGDMASTRVLEGPEVNVDGAEFWVYYDIGDDWKVSAHPDGAKVVEDKYVVLCEQKNWAKNIDQKKKIVALRQGALYLAMMRATAMGNEAAKENGWLFGVDPNYLRQCKTFGWYKHYVPAGVVRSVGGSPTAAPGEAYPQAFSDADLDDHLARMVEKAVHIKLAVEQRDLDIARRWDSDHPEEFGAVIDAEGAALRDLAAEYVDLGKAIDELELRRKALRDPLLKAVQANGGSWGEGGFAAKVQHSTSPGKWDKKLAEKDGVLDKYYTPGSTTERLIVTGPEEIA